MIRAIIIFLLFALVGLFIQSSVIHDSFPSALAPDFILILVVHLGLRFRTVPGLFGSFALGLLADFASGQYVGPHAAGAIVAFCLSGIIANRVYAEKNFALMLIAFLCCLAKSMTFIALLLLYRGAIWSGHELVSSLLIEAALTGFLAPFMLAALRWTRQAVQVRRRQLASRPSYGWSPQNR